jgi:Flp pilus assembly protein TadD
VKAFGKLCFGMGRGMASDWISRGRFAALVMAFGTAISTGPALAAAQYGYAVANGPGEAMSVNLRILADSPKDYTALIGAGKAALELGDYQAAAGFFARAEEVSPRSPVPQAGMGASLAHDGEAQASLRYFATAIQFGATQASIGAERGLAYDLMGQHALAQSDYRAAMAGPDADEARRRLALSLAISGNKTDALSTLAPLMARGDAGGARCRAFVLALTGDQTGARAVINARMPGASSQMAYFFQKLPTLRSDQKAAAVHLGVFPGGGQPSYGIANAEPEGDRLASIEALLRAPAPATIQPPVQMASIPAPQRQYLPATTRPSVTGQVYSNQRIWLQLASGQNAAALPDQYHRIKGKSRDVLDGINGYVVEEPGKARLVIGPFKNSEDAEIFAEDLASVRVDDFSWSNQPGQIIRKLSTE